MIYEVELSEQADSDLRGIFEYIALCGDLTGCLCPVRHTLL